jgi:hypothetical protein
MHRVRVPVTAPPYNRCGCFLCGFFFSAETSERTSGSEICENETSPAVKLIRSYSVVIPFLMSIDVVLSIDFICCLPKQTVQGKVVSVGYLSYQITIFMLFINDLQDAIC